MNRDEAKQLSQCEGCAKARRLARRAPGTWVRCEDCDAEYVSDGSRPPAKHRVVDPDTSAWHEAEHRVLCDMALIARWRAKQVAKAPGWTRSAGTTSAAIEDTSEGRDPVTGKRVRKIGLTPPALSRDDLDAVDERLDRIGREMALRLAELEGDVRRALERIVSGIGSSEDRAHAIHEIVGVALASPKERAAWKAAKCLWLNSGARGRPVWRAAVAAWCGVEVTKE